MRTTSKRKAKRPNESRLVRSQLAELLRRLEVLEQLSPIPIVHESTREQAPASGGVPEG
jgi:hypothetical protein